MSLVSITTIRMSRYQKVIESRKDVLGMFRYHAPDRSSGIYQCLMFSLLALAMGHICGSDEGMILFVPVVICLSFSTVFGLLMMYISNGLEDVVTDFTYSLMKILHFHFYLAPFTIMSAVAFLITRAIVG